MTREEKIYEHYRDWLERLGIHAAADREIYEKVSRSIVSSTSNAPLQRGHFPMGD